MKKEKRGSDAKEESPMKSGATGGGLTPGPAKAKPSSLLDTRVIYCGDNLEQLKKLPDQSIDLIYIDPPFNSNRADKGESHKNGIPLTVGKTLCKVAPPDYNLAFVNRDLQ